MPDIEKAIRGLEWAKAHPERDREYRMQGYDGKAVIIPLPLAEDALSLLKAQQERIAELEVAQEPRLMTLEEVHEMSWDYCYLEEEVIKDNVLQKYCGKHRVKCITWPTIASCVLAFGDDAYGKRWRCWTARPTDEQRRNAQWE